ncbi:MAG: hypothetical protein WBJ75_13820 [Pseudohongiellaceae bacterium]
MFRLVALSTALLLTLFLSVPGDFNPRTDKGVSYTALADDNAYTNQKHDEKKFLLRKSVSISTTRAIYFAFTPQVSVVIHEPETLNIRGPPATPVPV